MRGGLATIKVVYRPSFLYQAETFSIKRSVVMRRLMMANINEGDTNEKSANEKNHV